MSYAASLPPEAVEAHDMARRVPEEMWTKVIDDLAAHAPSPTICLDVGIGTGAVGGRLASCGVEVVGVDVNNSMLLALRRAHPNVPVVQGEAESLPVPQGVAALTVMACLLHLVYDWRRALGEAIRVTSSGGIVAVNVGQAALAGRTGISRFFLDRLSSTVQMPPMPGPESPEDVPAEMMARGCDTLPSIMATGTVLRTVAEHIFRLEWNPFGWPPGIPQQALTAAAEDTRRWARDEFGALDEPNPTPVTIGFSVFRVP